MIESDIQTVESSETYFAPAERSSPADITAVHNVLQAEPHLNELLDAMPLMVVILNSNRQIVAANQRVLEALGIEIGQVLGKRPGEAVNCIHAVEGPNGCGTNTPCRVCGAVNAILQTQLDKRYRSEECRILTKNEQALDWKVTTSLLELAGAELQCLTIEDISDRKRRHVLERTFFHDVVNTIGGIIGFSRILAEEHDSSDELREVVRLTDELLDEVQDQRALSLAESGDLKVNPKIIELKTFLEQTVDSFRNHPVAKGRKIILQSIETKLSVDMRLLKRVLINMIKNAVEASREGDTVSVFGDCQNGKTTISVHNPSVMSDDVKLQVFKRSFSTKEGAGRGIGTYSIKLLGEHYLGGVVSFNSEHGEGTTFSISLPRD